MNEYVYVMDIETYEMIYMNRKTLEAYGLKSRGAKAHVPACGAQVPAA